MPCLPARRVWSQSCRVRPTTVFRETAEPAPSWASMAATVEESTPPDMATAMVVFGDMGVNNFQFLFSHRLCLRAIAEVLPLVQSPETLKGRLRQIAALRMPDRIDPKQARGATLWAMEPKHYRYYETLRLFLACPGDLVAERSRFPRILETVNILRAHSMGFHLEPVGWERVVPSFGRPQELINKELKTADLTVVVFWNKIGAPSDQKGELTGTLEEFKIAEERYGDLSPYFPPEDNRPLLYVYFREQTEPDTESAARVREFRKTIEDGQKLLYRQYSQESEWEELLIEHLIGFLNGRRRADLETAIQRIPPLGKVMTGEFYWQALYGSSGILDVNFDFDGDDKEETVRFKFQQFRHWVTFFKSHSGSEIPMSQHFVDALNSSERIHLGLKDVTNDGVAELVIAASGSVASAMLGIYGMKDGKFSELAVLGGQFLFHVFERGHIIAPYGSVGLYFDYRWENGRFSGTELDDRSRPMPED